MELHQGIVLRANSAYKSTVTVLDKCCGKKEGFIAIKKRTHNLSHGALLCYSAKEKQSRLWLDDIHLLDMAEHWAGEHFLFFHHILELADYFLPLNQEASSVFQLLRLLYTAPDMVNTKQKQKTFYATFLDA